mgnify:CR=1 FL=1
MDKRSRVTQAGVAAGLSRRDRRRLRWFGRALRACAPLLRQRYGADRAEQLARDAYHAYAELLPTLPPISLARDPMAWFALAGVWSLALHQAGQPLGATAEDVGWVLIACLDRVYGAIPRWLRRVSGRVFLSAPSRWIIAALGCRSQRRRLLCTFVWRVVPDPAADLAIDYDQCPINTLLRDLGAGELVPYLCQTDYATFGALGVGFERTQTLAWACSHCDFRMSREGEPHVAWPPTFRERHCGRAEPVVTQEEVTP